MLETAPDVLTRQQPPSNPLLTGRHLVARFVGVVRENAAVIIAALSYVAVVHVMGNVAGWEGVKQSPRAQLMASWWAAGIVLVLWALFAIVRHRHSRPHEAWAPAWRAAFVSFWRTDCTLERLLGFLIVTQLLALSAASFMGWKSYVSATVPFRHDYLLMVVDRALHFGTDPWRLVHPLLHSKPATRALDVLYHPGWTFAAAFVPMVVAISIPSRERSRFLLGYILLWALLGTGMATLVPAAGPCYYGFVVDGVDPFAAQMERLADHRPLFALNAQELLWHTRTEHGAGATFGISAFPSLHVAYAFFLAAAGWRLGRTWRFAGLAFAMVTLVGSVHLGWHYAIDGYIAAAAAVLIWWLSGWIVQKKSGTRPNDTRDEVAP